MLAMNAQLFDDERQRSRDGTSHSSQGNRVDTTTATDGDTIDDDDDDVDNLDSVDGLPSPPVRVRPRRRFVKSGQTTYELSFSRRHVTARRAAGGGAAFVAAAALAVESDGPCDTRSVPVVSSLSHVLTEVLSGNTKALNNIVDTTPIQPNVTYVVEHAADGTLYVAASDGNKYFENSAIGQIFLKSARAKRHVRGRQSDESVGSSQRERQQQLQQHQPPPQLTRRSDGELAVPGADRAVKHTGEAAAAVADGDVKRGPETLLAFRGFHLRKQKEQKKGSATDVSVLSSAGAASVAGQSSADTAVGCRGRDHESFMSSRDNGDRSRANASCDMLPVVSKAGHERESSESTESRLVISNGVQTVHTAQEDLLAGLPATTNDSDGSRSCNDNGSSSFVSLSLASPTNSIGHGRSTAKTLPRLQPKKEVPASPLAPDAYDEQDNPLCRSFQNVRNVDLVPSKPRASEEDDQQDHNNDDEREHDEELEDAAAGVDDGIPDVNSPDFAGRVRVSSGATSVADFVGGFKGQLSRRSGASGLVNRKRAVRHARLSAEEQKAADLARKIREAHNRIPLEFRDEHMSFSALMEIQKKRKESRARGRHVSFNPDVLCREFEVVSEDEDDGYDSPDEIVDAVQLVSKRDVVRAEDVVAAFPIEQSGLPSEALAHGIEASGPSGLGANGENVQKYPLTFSHLQHDKRMSFSDL